MLIALFPCFLWPHTALSKINSLEEEINGKSDALIKIEN